MSTIPDPDVYLGRDLAWDVAQLFPDQGDWTDEEYLALPGNRLIELSDGRVEVLPWHRDRAHRRYWDCADLVAEVVTESDPTRDWEVKRAEYAQAGIPEYWIVDPRVNQITVLKLDGTEYAVHGQFGQGKVAASALLRGFQVDVTAVFAAAND
jgi:Uma2 family endonuclease